MDGVTREHDYLLIGRRLLKHRSNRRPRPSEDAEKMVSDPSTSSDGGAQENAELKVTLASAPGRGLMPSWYADLLASVVERVSTGRTTAVVAANRQMILTYWGIGRDILERQQAEGYGHRVIDRLSADLRERFPGAKGE